MVKKKRPYKYKLRFKLIFWSLVLMIIFSVANIFMNRPSSGTIIKHSLEDSPTSQSEPETNTITAQNFNLVYDAKLDMVSNITQQDTTALEVYRVSRSDVSGRRILVITIKKLPPGGASEESSYKLRHINPGSYSESADNFGDNSYTVFRKSDSSELTAFSVNGDRLAMISYTVQAPDADPQTEATKILKQFKWQ